MFNFGHKSGTPGTKLYKVLGIESNATEAEIKQAYKKQSLKWHPDRPNGDADKFKEINLANEVLSDPQKRKIYDESGEAGLEQMAQGGGGNPFPDDIMDLLMGGARRRRQRPSAPRQSERYVAEFEVSMEDLYSGKTLKFEYDRRMKCEKCKGLGCENKEDIGTCGVCKGSGQRVEVRHMGAMIQQQILPCQVCHASGKVVKQGKECDECMGQRIKVEKTELDIPIRAGMSQGDKICMKGKSHQNPDCPETGDLYLVIIEKASKTGLKRQGDDLLYDKEIDLVEALCGVSFYVKHLDGRYLKLSYNGIIHSNQVMKVEGEGMPLRNDGMGFGDMYVKFLITFPNKLSDKRKDLLEKILPKSSQVLTIKPTENDSVDEKELTVSESKYQSTYNNMRAEMTDDMISDEEDNGTQECIQQ